MEEIITVPIEDEVKQAYIDYSMSVIVSRALPDVRDGLKPVHRRILYAMDELHLVNNGPTRKCAKIVGDVLGKYHPHGDASVYDALVRLGQDFAQRYTLITPQGNFGTIAGDPAAAYRYTEAKMSRLAETMTADIDRETVDMIANFDETTKEPTVLPAKFPFLLCNGSMGIAVGMATNMASHNLKEVGGAICAYIDKIIEPQTKGNIDSSITVEGLMKYIKGPDFPTGAMICGNEGIKRAYATGRGKIVIKSKYETQTDKRGKVSLVFTEVPYAVNTTTIIKRIKDLARSKVIDGITDVNDETSDRTGLRLVVGLRRDANVKVVLNNLFSKTDLQANFNINNLALVDGRPVTLSLKDLIKYFVKHRDQVITRRTEFDLRKAREREHILKALIVAIDNIDEVIRIIRGSEDTNAAKEGLEKRFGFDDVQSQAIVDMQLKRLTHLQIEDLRKELQELEALIAHLEDLLAHHEKILAVIKEETRQIVKDFGDERRTQITSEEADSFETEDLIEEEDMVVLLSKFGYTKRIALDSYTKQNRGGVGVNSMALVENDYITTFFTGSTHQSILFVTTAGKVYALKVYEIPESAKASRGTNIKTILQLAAGEEITTTVSVKDFDDGSSLFMVTKYGVAKRIDTAEFKNANARGLRAINLKEGDTLINVILSPANPNDENRDMLIVTRQGKALRASASAIRSMGRTAGGVRAIKLADGDSICGAVNITEDKTVLLITEKGYGKRVKFSDFEVHGRGTGGQKIFGNTDGRGNIVTLVAVNDTDEVICMTEQGKTLRAKVDTIVLGSRTSSGIKIVKLQAGDKVIGADVATATVIKEDGVLLDDTAQQPTGQ